jgi:hypothetical protein
MSTLTTRLSTDSARRVSTAAKLNVAGLAVTAVGMLLQIAAGSTLYPSLAGPIVLLATALIVAFGPRRWTSYIGLAVPAVLGVGAIVAAAMTGDFIDQLADTARPAIILGTVLHVIGLLVAVAGGVRMVLNRLRGGA